MVHGLMLGSKSTWYFGIGPALAEKHRVLLYDLRGHGLSEHAATGYALKDMTADLEAVHATVGLEPMILVGHSYGGSLALRYASTYPERVKRLVLVDCPVPVISDNLSGLQWVRERQEQAVLNSGEDLMERMTDEQRDWLLWGMPDVIRDALMKKGKRPNQLLKQIMRLIGTTTMITDVLDEPPFTEDELRRVKCPVLLCFGAESAMLPGEGHMLLTALEDVELKVLPGGHYLPSEINADLIEAMKDFLEA
jgi:pimeloyl-ACP methyl ester carboxylesterase